MSLPPVTVRIKRKRTDEPVDFLQIHESESGAKRLRGAADFVFSRQPTPDNDPTSSRSSTPQPLRPIKQLPHSSSTPSLHAAATTRDTLANVPQTDLASLPPTPQSRQQDEAATPFAGMPTPTPSFDASQIPLKISQPRRFHIARSATTTNPLSPLAPGGVRKRRAEPTVFVERRTRPKSSQGESPRSEPQSPAAEPIRPQKKPGLAARKSIPPKTQTTLNSSPAPLRNVRLASGAVIPWDVTSEKLAEAMQAYTLQEIGKTLANAQAERPTPKLAQPARSPCRFKPKKPALRYAERHPEAKVDNNTGIGIGEEIVEDEDMDDADYIIDTYIRMPAEALASSETPKNIGLLILESQPDIDEFYRENDESDEEEEDEDEDENAEDHYTADYPEDEVDSDDEFDRNAYNYRTGNASDLEEYDEYEDEDIHFSENEDRLKYPWGKQPAWMKREKAIVDEDEDEDEE